MLTPGIYHGKERFCSRTVISVLVSLTHLKLIAQDPDTHIYMLGEIGRLACV